MLSENVYEASSLSATEHATLGTPIEFDQNIDIRFADLDPYGHVNASIYLDLVGTSRILYMKKVIGVPFETIAERGFGFYLKQTAINFRRPITGLVTVRCRSHVAKIVEGIWTISFKLESAEGLVHADGELNYALIDLRTQKKSREIAQWMMELFHTRVQ